MMSLIYDHPLIVHRPTFQSALGLMAADQSMLSRLRVSGGPSQYTWDPVTGCRFHCWYCCARAYAEHYRPRELPDLKRRDGIVLAPDGGLFPAGFELTFYPDVLNARLPDLPSIIQVGYYSDLGGAWWPAWVWKAILGKVDQHPEHVFNFLTKRPQGLPRMPANTIVGTAVENASAKHRINALRRVQAGLLFVSFCPLLGRVGEVDLAGFDHIVIGAHEGPGAQPPQKEWVDELVTAARKAGTLVVLMPNMASVVGPHPGPGVIYLQ